MKPIKILTLSLVLAAAASTLRAGWYGNLGKPATYGRSTAAGVVDIGSRKLETKSGNTQKLDVLGVSLQATHGFGHGVEVFGRLSPQTLRWEFNDSSFKPSLFGLGGGLQWTPAWQKQPLKVGFGAGFDWAKGKDNGTDINVAELSFAGGVGYAMDKSLDLYAGLSLIATDVNLKNNGVKTDLSENTPIGLFGGLNYRLPNGFGLGAEVRLINEQMVSLVGRYSFGPRTAE
ncbi:MAG: outer membrane beta-barrel protein [Elusimicrobia bacterium]|nr:outer membrane beta-barrel protein [Elusimicrobiota bacterium]